MSRKKEKVILSVDDLKRFNKALKIIRPYLKLNPHDVDFSNIFEKQPTREQLHHLNLTSSGFPFGILGSMLIIGDIWAHEFGTELKPEVKKFLKKIK